MPAFHCGRCNGDKKGTAYKYNGFKYYNSRYNRQFNPGSSILFIYRFYNHIRSKNNHTSVTHCSTHIIDQQQQIIGLLYDLTHLIFAFLALKNSRAMKTNSSSLKLFLSKIKPVPSHA